MNGEIQAKTTEQKHAKKLWKSANKFRRGGGGIDWYGPGARLTLRLRRTVKPGWKAWIA